MLSLITGLGCFLREIHLSKHTFQLPINKWCPASQYPCGLQGRQFNTLITTLNLFKSFV
jgi:hypothetical protein